MAEFGLYKFWSADSRGICDLPEQEAFKPAIRGLFPRDLPESALSIHPDCTLVLEPHGPNGPDSVSVRVDERTIGYLPVELARAWAGPIRRVTGSGLLPVAESRVSMSRWGWGTDARFWSLVRLSLGDPAEALPYNDPPTGPYTMVPRSSAIKVTKSDDCLADLLPMVPAIGRGMLFATLHERAPVGGRGKAIVEVRIDGRRVGELTSQTSQRYLTMIEHFGMRGLVCACYARISGSPVAAEVQIYAIKANEATDEFLQGEPVTLPNLKPHQSDPLAYDLTPMAAHLQTLPLPEGSLTNAISKSGGPQEVGEGLGTARRNGQSAISEPEVHDTELHRLIDFRTVRNLALLLAGEVGVITAGLESIFDESIGEPLPPKTAEVVESAMADVGLWLFRLADELSVDLPAVIREKLRAD